MRHNIHMPKIPANLIAALRTAKNVIAFTGAGTSAESGIPTFRDAQTGVWAQFRPEELATPQAFAAEPERVWNWYQWRRKLIEQAQPNAGHQALVALEDRLAHLSVITQNVDGLHQLAGSTRVIELHGSLRRYQCSKTLRPIEEDWLADHQECPPPSPHAAGAYARPAVVWFGESLPREALDNAYALSRTADVILSIGTSAVVEPAASLPLLAQRNGALFVEVNPQVTPLTQVADISLCGPSGDILPALVSAVTNAG